MNQAPETQSRNPRSWRNQGNTQSKTRHTKQTRNTSPKNTKTKWEQHI